VHIKAAFRDEIDINHVSLLAMINLLGQRFRRRCFNKELGYCRSGTTKGHSNNPFMGISVRQILFFDSSQKDKNKHDV
jgi:hypothetical protein